MTDLPPAAPSPAVPSPSSVIIACEMIEDEVLLALERSFGEGPRPPIVWFASGLHDRPEKLSTALQELIDLLDEGARSGRTVDLPSVAPGQGPIEPRRVVQAVPPAEDVLLAMGYCGGGLKELHSRETRLVFPRVDDCISLFLSAGCRREEIDRDPRSYYVTRGWFCHSSAMNDGFGDWIERYGHERARYLRRLMYAAYERVTLIDTGAYDVDAWLGHSAAYAGELELDHRLVSGHVVLLERLFRGPWDSEVVVIPPGETVTASCLFES